MNSNPIILVDAYAQIYRGFFAIRHLSNSKGHPTNAIFAVAKFLEKLEEEHPSPLGAFVFDLGKPEFRLELAPEYKANRPPMPDELKRQVPGLRAWIQAAGWPILESEGHEADDLIAGLAAAFQDHRVIVVSGDKDIAQIIDDRVKMLVPDRKGGGTKIQGVEEVTAKFGVRPQQIVDYLALIGDSSDNIPGVPGVGPKTAASLLSEHDSLENLLANLDAVGSEKIRGKLMAAKDVLATNSKLVSLDVTLPKREWAAIDAVVKKNRDLDALIALAEEFELKSLKPTTKPTEGDDEPRSDPEGRRMETPDLFDNQ